MSVARVTELSAISEQGFKDAIKQAIARASKTLRGVEGCWVKDMNVMIEVGNKLDDEVVNLLEENLQQEERTAQMIEQSTPKLVQKSMQSS